MNMRRWKLVLTGCGLLAWACTSGSASDSGGASGGTSSGEKGAAGSGEAVVPAATPVHAAVVRRSTLFVRVSGPGVTTAVQLDTLRAPFAGNLVEFQVQDGQSVSPGQVLGRIVSRDSAAALEGARSMVASAATPQDRADAERALELARRSLVAKAIRAGVDGVVVSHQVSAGALVAQDQELVAIAASSAIAFVVRMDQSDLARVRPGQAASVEIPAHPGKLSARVHGILPAAPAGASQNDASAGVRLDFEGPARPRLPGLYGTATIAVAEAREALVVPAAAVSRDDITGVTRVATITAGSRVHWVDVKAGIADGNQVQLVTPDFPLGTRVVTEGLVGLPEGAHVEVQP